MSRAATAAATLLGALALVSCGGGDEDQPTPTEPPAELLAQAAANPATSGDAAIDIDLDLQGDTPLAGGAGFEATGPFDLGDGSGLPAFELDGEGSVAGFGLDTDLISTGEDVFVIFFGENYRVGEEQVAQAEAALAEVSGGAGGIGLDVAGWFRDPAYAGSEEVGGTDTERIEGVLDAQAAAEDLSELARAVGAPFLTGLAEGAGSGPVEAWVAYEDDTIRRLRVQFPFKVPPDQLALTRGVESGTVAIDTEISDVGADVTIGVPAGGGFQPITDLTSRIESLASLGGL